MTEAKNDRLWTFLARDEKLLAVYAETDFGRGKEKFQYEQNMGIIFQKFPPKVATIRPLHIAGLEHGSNIYGGYLLDGGAGRMIGVKAKL